MIIHAHPYSAPEDTVPIDWEGESPEEPSDDEYDAMMAAWNSINCKLTPAE